MLGCEIDCYDPSTVANGCKAELKDCVELKTSRWVDWAFLKLTQPFTRLFRLLVAMLVTCKVAVL